MSGDRRDSRLPFTTLLPDSALQPIEVHDHSVGLRMAIVEKSAVRLLDDDWDVPGAYVLLDRVQEDGVFGVYVGKAPAGLRNRLLNHERNKDWHRALLIQRSTQFGFSSAHVAWLEGDLYALFDSASCAQLHNSMTPGDDTVPSYELRILESFRDPISRVLRLIGYGPDSADEEPIKAPGGQSKFYGVSMTDLMTAGLLHSGDRLVSVNSSWPAIAEVGPEGSIAVEGQAYATPSAAASAVKGGAANGWDFWALEGPDGSTRLSTLRTKLQDQNGTLP